MPMRAGDLVIFPAGSMNSWRWESDASCLWCAWSGELAGTVATSLRRYPTCVPQAIPAAEQLAALVKPVVYNRCYDSIDAERYLVGFTEQLLAILTPPKATPEQPHSPLIGRALALIEREYAHLTVASLAEALLVDSTYLSRVFRRELGETPKQAITRTRMVYADYYLVGTQYSLAHIAELVGYANYTNFYVAFRAHYGCSPELYRRTNSDIKL